MSARRHIFTSFVHTLARLLKTTVKISRKIWRALHHLSLKTLLIIVVLLAASIVLLIKISSLHVGKINAWWDDTWHYRKSVPVTNISSATTDYQIKITVDTQSLIAAGKMQPNCGDLRFTNSTGTLLPYWVETGTFSCNKYNTAIWIKVDSIPNTGTTSSIPIYMYYGNPAAAPGSNGTNTFVFFDGFDGNSLDTTKWSYLDASGISLSNGYLRATSTTGWIQSIPTFDKSSNLIVETSVIATTIPTNGFCPLGTWVSTVNAFSSLIHPGSPITLYYYNDGAWVYPTGTNSITTLLVSEYILNSGSNAIYYYNSTNNSLITSATNITNSVDNEPLRLIRRPDNLNTGQAMDASWDFVRVRKYNGAISTGSFGAEEKGTGPIVYYNFDEGSGTTLHNQLESINENGLVGWWKMDENTGIIANDETKGNPGTVTNTGWEYGKIGTALRFNGTSAYVSIPDSNSLDLTTGLTFSAWIKRNATGVYDRVVAKDHSSTGMSWDLQINSANTLEFLATTDGTTATVRYCKGNTTIDTNWHHIATTYDGTNVSIYVDGMLDTRGRPGSGGCDSGTLFSGSLLATDQPLFLGRLEWGGTNYWFSGLMDSVKLYNRAISDTEITTEANSLQAAMINFGAAGVAATWPDGAPYPADKNSPQGRSLTFNGVDQYALTATSPKLPFGNSSFSVTYWIKPTSTAASRYVYMWGDSSTAIGTGNVMIYNPTTQSLSHNFWSRPLDTPTGSVPLNTWTSVTVTYNGTVRSIYLNGKLSVSDNPTSINVSPNFPLTIGAYNYNGYLGSSTFAGTLDEFKIYDYVIPTSQISAGFQMTNGVRFGTDDHVSDPGNNGLLYWFKFNEGTGTSIVDSSPAHRKYLLNNGSANPTWSKNSRNGSSLYFDGGDNVNLDNNMYSTMSEATIEGWLNYAGNYSTNYVLWSSYKDGNNRSPVFVNTAKKLVWELFVGSTNYSVTSTSNIPVNVWTHFALTCGTGGRKLYINGALEATLADTNCLSALGTGTINQLGSHNNSAFYQGYLDNIKTYTRALSANEIGFESTDGQPVAYYDMNETGGTTLHNRFSSGIENGLVRWYKMDETAGTTVYNQTQISNSDGTAVGGTSIIPGRTGNGRQINAIGKGISFTPFSTGTDWTMSIWAQWPLPANTGSWWTFFANDGGTYHHIIINEANGEIGSYNGTWYSTGFSTTSLSAGWHQIAASATGGYTAFFVDGIKVGTISTVTNYNVGIIGNYSSAAGVGTQFVGNVDNAKIYSRALSANEIYTDFVSSDAAIINYASWTDGARANANQNPMGKAISFNGTTQYAVAPSSPTLNLTESTPFTISTWIKRNSIGTTEVFVNKQENTTNEFAFVLRASGDKATFVIAKQGVLGSGVTGTTTLIANNWYHLIGVYDGTNIKIYVNGRLEGTATRNFTNSTPCVANLYLGQNNDNTLRFNGLLDEIRIFPYALSDADVKAEYNHGGSASALGIGQASNNPSTQIGTSTPPLMWLKMDDGSGAVAYDSSPNSNNAYFGNTPGPTWTLGYIGKGLFFNGSTDYMNISNVHPFTNPFTVSFWVNFDAVNKGNDNDIIVHGAASTDNGFHILERSGKMLFSFWADDITGSTTLSPNHWYYMTFIYTGTQKYIYLDGKLDASGNSNAYQSTLANTVIGTAPWSNANMLLGTLDNFKIWSRVLSPSEIAYDYNQGKPINHWRFNEKTGTLASNEYGTYNRTTGLVGFWPMESVPALDYSGNNYTLALGGAPTSVTGIRGLAVNTSGSTQYLFCDYSTCPGLDASTNGLTISSWIRNNASVGNTNTNMINKFYNSSPTNNGGYSLYYGIEGHVHLSLFNSSGTAVGGDADSETTLPQNVWTHVVGKYDGSYIYIYINGVQKAKTAYTGGIKLTTTSSSFVIGGPSAFFNGAFDHTKIWNRPLTDQEVITEFQSDERYGYLTNFPTDNSQWVVAKSNNGLNIGTSDFVTTSESPAISKLSQSTITAWIKPSSTAGILYDEFVSSTAVYRLNLDASNKLTLMWYNSSFNYLTSTSALNNNQWYYVAAVFDINGPKLYINGNLDASYSSATTPNTINVTKSEIGASIGGLFGTIDEIKTYTYALTPDQIKVDMNDGAAVRLN